MAIGVIGGLIVSTALSLVFVPSFYTVMDDLSAWTARQAGRLLTPRDAVAAAPGPKEPAGARQPAE